MKEEKILCSCGFPQSFPIPHEHDQTKREKEIILGMKILAEIARKEGFEDGMKRHTWMKDGVTYVGNGTYTLKESLNSARSDGFIN